MSTDLDISYTISRAELSLSPLEVNNKANGYTVITDSAGPGEKTIRRITADSPWVEGRKLIAAVRDTMTMSLGVMVRGINDAQVVSRVNTLVNALDQFAYTITFTIDGQVWGQWECEVADVAVGDAGVIQGLHLFSHFQPVRATIPRNPRPSAGVM